jgi:hypothetical protein
MMPLLNPENSILNTKRIVESNKHSEIRLNANGGNSVLIVCEPLAELDYINAINKLMDKDTYQIIDLNNLLLGFIDTHKDELAESFELLKGSVEQVFKASVDEDRNDFYKLIINEISASITKDKLPVLVNCGILYGSKINFNNLLEEKVIANSKFPLIVLYPATIVGEQILFLSKRIASDYRCMIIN